MFCDIILDTDLGCDCDDVAALSELCILHKKGVCSLKGVCLSAPFEYSPVAVRSILNYYGTGNVKIGAMTSPADGYYSEGRDNYAKAVYEAFPCGKEKFYDSVMLSRALLAEAENPVKIVVVGSMTNIAALLETGPDDLSELDGTELVRRKAAEIDFMAGDFSHLKSDAEPRAEWNVTLDISAVRNVLNRCPCPMVFLPSEAGADVISCAPVIARDKGSSPLSAAFTAHGSPNGRSSWDPLTVYYAVLGNGSLFEISGNGVISCRSNGVLDFREDQDGHHRYLNLKCSEKQAADALDKILLSFTKNQ